MKRGKKSGLEATPGNPTKKPQGGHSQSDGSLTQQHLDPQLNCLTGPGLYMELHPVALTPSREVPAITDFDGETPTVTPAGYQHLHTREAVKAQKTLARIEMGQQVLPHVLTIITKTLSECEGFVWTNETVEERALVCAKALVPYLRIPIEDEIEPDKNTWQVTANVAVTFNGSGNWEVTVKEFPNKKYPIPSKLAQLLITTLMLRDLKNERPDLQCYKTIRDTALARTAEMMGKLVAKHFTKNLHKEGE